MFIGLGADIWFSFSWVGALFLDFCFLSGFEGSMMAICYPVGNFLPFPWPAQLAASQGMPAGIGAGIMG